MNAPDIDFRSLEFEFKHEPASSWPGTVPIAMWPPAYGDGKVIIENGVDAICRRLGIVESARGVALMKICGMDKRDLVRVLNGVMLGFAGFLEIGSREHLDFYALYSLRDALLEQMRMSG